MGCVFVGGLPRLMSWVVGFRLGVEVVSCLGMDTRGLNVVSGLLIGVCRQIGGLLKSWKVL